MYMHTVLHTHTLCCVVSYVCVAVPCDIGAGLNIVHICTRSDLVAVPSLHVVCLGTVWATGGCMSDGLIFFPVYM